MVATSGSGKGVSLGADIIGFNYGAQHDVDPVGLQEGDAVRAADLHDLRDDPGVMNRPRSVAHAVWRGEIHVRRAGGAHVATSCSARATSDSMS